MTRVTRSQLDTIDQPVRQYTPLAELDVSMAANTAEDATAASELNALKAAYRGALGIAKRGKKSRNKRKDKQELESHEMPEGKDTLDNTIHNPIPEATNQLLISRQGNSRTGFKEYAYRNLLQGVENTSAQQQNQTSAPIGRTTRRQAAQAQAGEYNLSDIFIPKGDTSALTQRLRDVDYVSLFAGRFTRPARSQQHLSSAQGVRYEKFRTDHASYLAEEARTSRQDASEQDETGRKFDLNVAQNERSNVPVAPMSPVKTLAEVEEVYGSVNSPAPAETEDSFVEQIISRSPAKPVSRIEDSLEALDQLEEALEAIGEVTLAERIVPTEKVRDRSHTPNTRNVSLERSKSLRATKPEAVASGVRKFNSVKGEAARPGYGSVRVKPTAPKQTSILKKAASMNFSAANSERKRIEEPSKGQPIARMATKRPISLLPPKETVKSTKPLTRPTFELPGEAIARKLKEQREARVAQRSASEDSLSQARVSSESRHKSTKPPTKAVFELPGEAVSRKKREALEARLKIQEEEERQRREFKARPIRKSVIPDYIPRETAASRARQSKISPDNSEGGELAVPKRAPSNGANIGAHRPSAQPIPQANVSAPRSRVAAPIRKQSPTTHGLSMSGRAMPRTVTANDVQAQRQRAKEIYERDAKWTEDMGRERRDREAAAKRAREEAAERGRQASREWAEKQMVRKFAENDKMGPGYGPGGQLGLRS